MASSVSLKYRNCVLWLGLCANASLLVVAVALLRVGVTSPGDAKDPLQLLHMLMRVRFQQAGSMELPRSIDPVSNATSSDDDGSHPQDHDDDTSNESQLLPLRLSLLLAAGLLLIQVATSLLATCPLRRATNISQDAAVALRNQVRQVSASQSVTGLLLSVIGAVLGTRGIGPILGVGGSVALICALAVCLWTLLPETVLFEPGPNTMGHEESDLREPLLLAPGDPYDEERAIVSDRPLDRVGSLTPVAPRSSHASPRPAPSSPVASRRNGTSAASPRRESTTPPAKPPARNQRTMATTPATSTSSSPSTSTPTAPRMSSTAKSTPKSPSARTPKSRTNPAPAATTPTSAPRRRTPRVSVTSPTAASSESQPTSSASPQPTALHEKTWTIRFTELQSYLQEHGDIAVPEHYYKYPMLHRWMERQQVQYQAYKKGKSSTMTAERLAALQELGMTFP